MVPREFMGMARAFYQRVLKTDETIQPTTDQVSALVMPRLRNNKPTLRPEMILAAERLWKDGVPDTFRIALAFQHPPKRHGLRIRECRLTCIHSRDKRWDDPDDEKNIALSMIDFRVDAERCKITRDLTPFVQVSLHALARRYERGRPQTDQAVFDDLVCLAKPGFFDWTERIAVASGVWLGERREFDLADPDDNVVAQSNCFTVRTFYDNDMLLDGAKLTI